MDSLQLVLGITVGLVLGAVIGIFVFKSMISRKSEKARYNADAIMAEAKKQSQDILEDAERKAEREARQKEKKAEEEYRHQLKKFEREFSKKRQSIDRQERKLESRQTALDRMLEGLEKKEDSLEEREKDTAQIKARLSKREDELGTILTATKRRCEEVSGLTEDEAKKLFLEIIETDVRQESAALVRRIEAESKESADKKARQIITLAIQRCAAEQVTETTVSVVQLPKEELKGRIIGREGRNIRALEAATGCNIIVDDTPEAVVLSCFDPIRREIARMTLEKLISDGRIHPARIEEIVAKVEKDLNDTIREAGEQAVFELGIPDIHPEVIKVMGRLKYRTSYGQNILAHSVEVARLCSFMASELGADVEAAKRSGFLHDIGKALTHEVEGTHAAIGADLIKKHREAPGIVHAVAAHHNEVEPRTIIAVLVQAADALSSARPGARRETLENYVKRLKQLEEIADGFGGVTKAYALQAGREIRIVVEPTEINDNEACLLARDVSKKIEKEVEYPGHIRITVCRETRATEYAK